MANAVRAQPANSELTLGLGLRVVRALVAQQPALRLHQHHGRRTHATSLVLPAAPNESASKLAAAQPALRA